MKRDHFRQSREAARRMGIDWLLSLDTDELLHIRCNQRVARKGTARWFFSQQSTSVPAVNIRNWEALYKPGRATNGSEQFSYARPSSFAEAAGNGIGNEPDEPSSMRYLNQSLQTENMSRARCFEPLAFRTKFDYRGYFNGKSAGRVEDERMDYFGSHHCARPAETEYLNDDQAVILHFEACTYNRFIVKFWKLALEQDTEHLRWMDSFKYYRDGLKLMRDCRSAFGEEANSRGFSFSDRNATKAMDHIDEQWGLCSPNSHPRFSARFRAVQMLLENQGSPASSSRHQIAHRAAVSATAIALSS